MTRAGMAGASGRRDSLVRNGTAARPGSVGARERSRWRSRSGGRECVFPDRDGATVDEARRPAKDGHPEAGEALGRMVRRDRGDHSAHMRHDGGKVGLRILGPGDESRPARIASTLRRRRSAPSTMRRRRCAGRVPRARPARRKRRARRRWLAALVPAAPPPMTQISGVRISFMASRRPASPVPPLPRTPSTHGDGSSASGWRFDTPLERHQACSTNASRCWLLFRAAR